MAGAAMQGAIQHIRCSLGFSNFHNRHTFTDKRRAQRLLLKSGDFKVDLSSFIFINLTVAEICRGDLDYHDFMFTYIHCWLELGGKCTLPHDIMLHRGEGKRERELESPLSSVRVDLNLNRITHAFLFLQLLTNISLWLIYSHVIFLIAADKHYRSNVNN